MPLSDIWTLARVEDGVEQTLAQWGISQATRTQTNGRTHEMSLNFQGASIVAGVPLAPLDHIIVKRSGVTYFVGRIFYPGKGASGSSENYQVTARGTGSFLDSTVMLQVQKFRDPAYAPPLTTPEDADPTFFDQLQKDANAAQLQFAGAWHQRSAFTPLIITGVDATTGAVVPTGTTAAQAASFALDTVDPVTGLARGLLGTTFAGVQIPREQLRAVACAELIRKMMQWTPDIGTSWDDTTTPPTLNFVARGTMAARTFTLGTDAIVTVQIKPRPDLQLSGVVIYFITGLQVGTLALQELTTQIAGVIDENTLHFPFDLDAQSMDPGTGVIDVPSEPVPSGVADGIFAAYSQLFYEGQLEIVGQECTGEDWIKKVVNMEGGEPAWVDMRAMVQSAVDTLHTGRTVLTLGVPPQLSAQDIAGRLRYLRSIQTVGSAQVAGTQGGGGPRTTIAPGHSSGATPGALEDITAKVLGVDYTDVSTTGKFSNGHLYTGTRDVNTPGGSGPALPFPDTPPLDTDGGAWSTTPKTDLRKFSGIGPHTIATKALVKFSLDLSSFDIGHYRKVELVCGWVSNISGGSPTQLGTAFSYVGTSLGRLVPDQFLPEPPVIGTPPTDSDNRTVPMFLRLWTQLPPPPR